MYLSAEEAGCTTVSSKRMVDAKHILLTQSVCGIVLFPALSRPAKLSQALRDGEGNQWTKYRIALIENDRQAADLV
jgi:hypothetical protein